MGGLNKKILLVDDDPSIIKLLQRLLSRSYEVITAKNGAEAMAQVKTHKPDMIVLDIMMPEINGYDVCRTLKFDSPYKDIPILLLTSREQEMDSRIGQMMGIDYMQKPLNREAFLAKVSHVLK
ncbi:MAG: response regulator [Candidatus Omnitrophica bacterium]|nr:response regulator [Candidatus Omnitrophota bacterium]